MLRISRVIVLALLFVLVFPRTYFAETIEDFKVSGGVKYQYNQEVMKVFNNEYPQAIRHMTVDLSDPHTTIDVGYPNPLNKLVPTTIQANNYTKPGQQVAGAINGSFYWSSDQHYLPMYLISYRDRLMNAGVISSGKDQFVNKPYAFGIDKNGLGKIDRYDLELIMRHDGVSYPLTSTDKARTNDNLILYTPLFPFETTKTNELGIELVISNVAGGTALEFGKELTGTVTKIRKRHDKNESVIPEDGFVLSAHGDAMQYVKDIQIGEEISFKAEINEAWKGSSFMLTSGPHLVMDGKVNLGIDETSDRARERAPRTAIAIDKTGTKAFMVTVDGRQGNYSAGMNLKEFATHLVELGADRALNLDGGGSTTMALRKPGEFNVSLFNKPSDQNRRERSVSTTLFALSTAPEGPATTIASRLAHTGVYLKGTKGSIIVDHLMDNYYNPVEVNGSVIKLSSPQGLITTTGLDFTAQQVGIGTIDVQHGQAKQSLAFEVIDKIATLEASSQQVTVQAEGTEQITLTVKDDKGRTVVYDPSLVKWSATPSIGEISTTGLFTASKNPGTGVITAQLANQQVDIPVTIVGLEDTFTLDHMESLENWEAKAVRGTATAILNKPSEPAYEGAGAVKLAYDFSKTTGTSAAYLVAKSPLEIPGNPKKISARVFGDASQTWLRAKIADDAGKEYTIDFTKEKGLTWIGWNYVTANIPASITGEVTLKEIYVAQPTDGLKAAGSIMVDDVKAIYKTDYKEGLFKDTGVTFRAEQEISALVSQGIIAGYADGNFGPYDELTRQQGAILLARALNLPLDNVKDPGFEDMVPTMNFYKEVSAVANANIIKGKENGTKFDPNGKLTRAEMAAILQRSFQLEAGTKNYFNDSNGSFALESINALAHNKITEGIGAGKFGPAQNISRADFSVFLYRSMQK